MLVNIGTCSPKAMCLIGTKPHKVRTTTMKKNLLLKSKLRRRELHYQLMA